MATTRHRKPENFLAAVDRQGDGIAEHRVLGRNEQASEALLMGLRLAEGVDLAELAQRFDVPPIHLIDDHKLALYRDLGLVWTQAERLGVTDRGMPLLDALLGELVAGELVSS